MGASQKQKGRSYLVPKQHSLDQFYTKPSIVEKVLEMIDCSTFDLVVEPSAGAGDFLKRLPQDKRIGIDLEPALSEIRQGDFFDFVPDITSGVLTIGNPPFGKNSSLAVKFFNHAAQFSDCIAFIVPRTFRKPSLINRLNSGFHLVKQEILEVDAFYLPSGESYAVPTVFQVWERKNIERDRIETTIVCQDFDFVSIEVDKKTKKPTLGHTKAQQQQSDFCVRRVGGYAGKVYTDFKQKKRDWKSHYYIKQKTKDVYRIMQSINWNFRESPKYDTAGNPSISKHDLIKFYSKAKEEQE